MCVQLVCELVFEHMALCYAGHQTCIGILLKGGANINQQDKRGLTPLFVAVNGGHFFSVQHLIKAGADPTVAASDARTALFAAAANPNPSSLAIFDCLLETAANKQALQKMISVSTKDKRTILHSACASSNVDVVQRLLKAGAAVNVQSDDGATPLARVWPSLLSHEVHQRFLLCCQENKGKYVLLSLSS